MVQIMSKYEPQEWTDAQIEEATRIAQANERTAKWDADAIRGALDKAVGLTVASDAQRVTFGRVLKAMHLDLAKVTPKTYAGAVDIDRIYLQQVGPDGRDAQVKALIVALKDDHGMNANQVAALVGIPPRLINGLYASGKKAAQAAAPAEELAEAN